MIFDQKCKTCSDLFYLHIELYGWISIILYYFLQKIWLFEKLAVYLHCGIILPEFADSRIVKWRKKINRYE